MTTTRKPAVCEAKILTPRHYETRTERTYDFTKQNKDDGWYAFPATADGLPDVMNMTEAAIKNLEYCLAHPDVYVNRGVREIHFTDRVPALFRCVCGEEFYLEGSYMGADGCPACDRWYNMSGQSLNPPSTWREGQDW